MNDEIKEILDRIEATFETAENNSFVKFKWLDYKQLLDYISNLQQEFKEANESVEWWTNRFKAMQKENERLKENNQAYQKEVCYTWDERDDLYRRIYKAIEYIENELFKGKEDLEWCRKNDGCISGSDLPAEEILHLYDILKGDSDENN